MTDEPVACYQVRGGDHSSAWAHCYVRCYNPMPTDTLAYHGGELVVYSSYGTFGQHWAMTAQPFRMFLQQLDFESFMQRAWPGYCAFDLVASTRAACRAVRAARRARRLARLQARGLYDALWELARGGVDGAAFVAALYRMDDLARVPQDRYDFVVHRTDDAALAFWRDLWPPFLAALRAEPAA